VTDIEYVPGREPLTLREMLAIAWDEGFDTGHYSEGEEKMCECKANPYR
jgi:hypothetical protein